MAALDIGTVVLIVKFIIFKARRCIYTDVIFFWSFLINHDFIGIDVSSKPQANSNNHNVVNSTMNKNDGRGDRSRKLQRRQTEPIKLSYGTLKMVESCVETEKALAAVIEEIS